MKMKLGCKIGVGNTAEVYEWGNGRIIKLFNTNYPTAAVEREYMNARSIKNLNFWKAREHGIVTYGDRTGIVYDRLEGESLVDYLMRTGDIPKTVVAMTGLHNAILDQEMFDDNIPYYKKFLNEHIGQNPQLTDEQKEDYHKKVSSLPDDSQLCHGDFHPGNIILTEKGAAVIDFMNICRGPRLYDVARTYFLLNSPPPFDLGEEREQFEQARNQMVDEYLASMRVMPEELVDYLEVIEAARKSEELS